MKNSILNNINWCFYGDIYSSEQSFKSELLSLQTENFDDSILDEICVVASEIEVLYWAYVDDQQVDRKLTIKAGDSGTLSALEILYQLNKLVGSDLENIDHYFFQGLIENDPPSPLDSIRPRSFTVWQGS